MRITALLLVIAVHIGMVLLLAWNHRQSSPHQDTPEPALTSAYFVIEPERLPQLVPSPAQPPRLSGSAHRAAHRAGVTQPPAAVLPAEPAAPTPAPDWRLQGQVAVDSQLQARENERLHPSPLTPHDFTNVRPGSTDVPPPQFVWDYAATHRVQVVPGGAVINLNDRCALVLPIPFVFCRIGRMDARGNLFEHAQDPHP